MESAESSKPLPLPTAKDSFVALVRTHRTYDECKALYERILAESPWKATIEYGPRVPLKPTHAGAKLLEQRLLEFSRHPKQNKTYGWLFGSHESAWEDLEALRSRVFFRRLRAWTRHRNTVTRNEAIEQIAKMQRSQDLLFLVRLIRTRRMSVVAAIASGADSGPVSGRKNRAFVGRIVEELLPFVDGRQDFFREDSDENPHAQIFGLLEGLGKKSSLKFMGGPQVLRIENPAYSQAVWSLSIEAESDPWTVAKSLHGPSIWGVFEALKVQSDPKLEYLLGAALVLCTLVDPERGKQEAKALRPRAKKNSDLSMYIRRALRTAKKTPEVDALIELKYKGTLRLGRDGMAVLAAHELARHVRTDGLDLYFHNMGHEWREARWGLVLIGKERCAELVAAGAKIAFGSKSVKTEAEAGRLYDLMSEKRQAALEKVVREYHRIGDGVIAAGLKYMDKHPEKFRV